MKIRRLRIENWRGVAASDVAFGDGVTIVAGPNETGKSSLLEALRCLFRYPDDSGHRDIKAVRPVHVDAAPAVTLEADLGEVRIVYAKRYRKPGRSGETTLRISAPGRNDRTLTGREAHDRADALLGEDIDRDLWEALQIEQGSGVAQARLKDRQGLQEALDAAAGNDAGLGAEDASLIGRIQAEYDRYFTPTGKARGDFANLPAAVAAAGERHRQLELRMAALRDIVARHREQALRQRRMAEQLPAIEATALAHEAEWRRVQDLQTALGQSELVLRNARLGLDGTTADRDARRELGAGIERLREAAAAGDAELASADAALASQQATLARHRVARDEIAKAQEAADARQRSVQAALDLRQSRRELERVQAALDNAAVLGRRLDEVRAVVAAIAIEERDLVALRALQQEQVRAAAAAEAAAPEVRITALRALDIEVRGRAHRLAAGETLSEPASAGLAVVLPGQLELAVSGKGEMQARADEAKHAQSTLDARLRGLRVASLAEAETRLAEKKEARAQAQALQQQRDGWLGGDGADALKARSIELAAAVDGLAAMIQDVELPDDDATLRETLRADLAAAQDAKTRIAALDALCGPLESTIGTAREQRAELLGRLRSDRQRIALDQGRLDGLRADLSDEALDAELERARARLDAAALDHRERQAAYEQANPERAELLAGNSGAALQRHRSELDQLRVGLSQLEGQLEQARHEGLFDQLTEAATTLQRLQADYRRIARRAAAAQRLWDLVGRHRAAASRRYVGPLKEGIDALGRLVFNDSFSVEIDESLAVVNRSLDGVTVPFDSLSIGAQEQVGILARLAAAQLVGRHADVPLLMDDTLGYADDGRLANMGAAIARVARDNQVIILTCMPSRFAYVGDATTVSV